jgi:hypothetical protein
MTNIYGSVGYTLLRNKYNTILIFADVHSKLPYCENKIDISDWFKDNMNFTNVLLEEVPRDGVELNELWTESEHTQKLKNLFLQNSNLIHAIDIRPYLIPFSWEMCELKTDNNIITLNNYLKKINVFLELEDDYFKKKLSLVYNEKYLIKNVHLGKHFLELHILFNSYKEKYAKYMEKNVCDIFKENKIILEEFNNILDSTMEWFAIAKMFQLKFNKKNVIMHTGLYHSNNIRNKLMDLYEYKIIDNNGINTIKDIENNKNYSGCISLSPSVTSQLSIINN